MLDYRSLPRKRLETMLAAGEEVIECFRVLNKGGSNVTAEVLKGQGEFIEFNHYPKGDSYDNETHSQYYYHAHRAGENGHFHTFMRQRGMPAGIEPIPYMGDVAWPKGTDALSHLIAISMDKYGFPLSLFTTNRWVTGENWYVADDACRMLDRFDMDHAYPSWATNRWLTAMVRLFRPQIVELIQERDRVVAAAAEATKDGDIFEDRSLEVTSEATIDVDEQTEAIETALKEGPLPAEAEGRS